MTDPQTISPSPPSSPSLWQGLKRGDIDSWNRMVELYAPLAKSWALYAGVPGHRVGDILQEVFLSIHRSINDFQPTADTSGFRGWVWSITKNKIRDYFRREAEQPIAKGGSSAFGALSQFPDPVLPDEPPSTPGDTSSLLHRALNMVRVEFRERTWEAFWRSTVLGQATDRVAEELGVSTASVRQAKSRILRRLRQQLGDLE